MDFYLGDIRMFAGNFAPLGWALCDGRTLSIAENDALYVLIGNTYGGDGISTFALPDLRGRVPVHIGAAGAGLPVVALGEPGGKETVTITGQNAPAHSHTTYGVNVAGTVPDPTNAMMAMSPSDKPYYYKPGTGSVPIYAMDSRTVGQTGDPGEVVSIVQPYAAINFIIATTGIFPSLT